MGHYDITFLMMIVGKEITCTLILFRRLIFLELAGVSSIVIYHVDLPLVIDLSGNIVT